MKKMSRLAPYVGITIALALGVLLAIFLNSVDVVYAPPITIPSPVSTSTPPITSATTTTEKMSTTSVPISKPVTKPVAKPAPSTPPAESAEVINAKLNMAAAALRAALVNILCIVPAGTRLHSISGSGVIIDPKGIILTNAHIAQYYLLSDRGVSCTIRSGSPAVDTYDAALLYVSPVWIKANPTVLTESLANGTGQYDFAFLAITKSATSNPLPASFPYVPLAVLPPRVGIPIVIASYGAQFLASSQIESGLFPTIVFGSVKDIFTFEEHTVDVLALGGSVAAQEGSSGGGVVGTSGTLIGTVTTSTVTGTTDTRSLNAITASYVRAEYASETGQPLDFLLATSTTTAVSNFSSQIPSLEAIITANL